MSHYKMGGVILSVLTAKLKDVLFEQHLESGESFHIRLEQSGYLPLVVEVIGKNKVSVAHYYEQNGDIMADPEIVFAVVGDDWYPIELTQAPVGVWRPKFFKRNGVEMVDMTFHKEVMALVNVWAKNIVEQKWAIYGKEAE